MELVLLYMCSVPLYDSLTGMNHLLPKRKEERSMVSSREKESSEVFSASEAESTASHYICAAGILPQTTAVKRTAHTSPVETTISSFAISRLLKDAYRLPRLSTHRRVATNYLWSKIARNSLQFAPQRENPIR